MEDNQELEKIQQWLVNRNRRDKLFNRVRNALINDYGEYRYDWPSDVDFSVVERIHVRINRLIRTAEVNHYYNVMERTKNGT